MNLMNDYHSNTATLPSYHSSLWSRLSQRDEWVQCAKGEWKVECPAFDRAESWIRIASQHLGMSRIVLREAHMHVLWLVLFVEETEGCVCLDSSMPRIDMTHTPSMSHHCHLIWFNTHSTSIAHQRCQDVECFKWHIISLHQCTHAVTFNPNQ